MNLAAFTKRRRGQLGLSQAALAAASKGAVSPVSVCDIELGRSVDIKVSMAMGLARALKVDAGVIIAAVGESLTEQRSG